MEEGIEATYQIAKEEKIKTKEEAKFRLEQIKVYNELKNFADENNGEMNWRNFQEAEIVFA